MDKKYGIETGKQRQQRQLIPQNSHRLTPHIKQFYRAFKSQAIISKANKIAVINNKAIPAIKITSAIFSNR
jgi:hypothetical protein